MIIYCPTVSVTRRMLKLCENGSNIDYLYETSSVLRKATETKISGLTIWLRFGFLKTEPKFGFLTSLSGTDKWWQMPIIFTHADGIALALIHLCVIVSVCLSVCTHYKTKTAETKIAKLGTGITIPRSPMNIRSKVKVRVTVRQLNGRRELCTSIECSSSCSCIALIIQSCFLLLAVSIRRMEWRGTRLLAALSAAWCWWFQSLGDDQRWEHNLISTHRTSWVDKVRCSAGGI